MTTPPHSETASYRDITVADWLNAVAAPEPTPGGGGAAALTSALAAALVAMAARFSRTSSRESDGERAPYDDADELAARADALRERALALAEDDAIAYTAVLAAYRQPKETEGRGARIKEALQRACEVPLQIAEGAAEVASLGADIGIWGNPNLVGDASTGVHLAVAAARSSAELLLINVRLGDLGPGPADRARALVDTAEAAAQRLSGERGPR